MFGFLFNLCSYLPAIYVIPAYMSVAVLFAAFWLLVVPNLLTLVKDNVGEIPAKILHWGAGVGTFALSGMIAMLVHHFFPLFPCKRARLYGNVPVSDVVACIAVIFCGFFVAHNIAANLRELTTWGMRILIGTLSANALYQSLIASYNLLSFAAVTRLWKKKEADAKQLVSDVINTGIPGITKGVPAVS